MPYLSLASSQIRVGGICDALRKCLPEMKFILRNLEPSHWLVQTGTLARPEDETAKVFAIRPVRVSNRVPKRTHGIVGKELATTLRH